ncbi:MAG: hypothetical protein K0Q63_2354 [Paenibacillus sp.]|nr:hypothetical protein [Paenibacillus sp.]
MMAGFTEKGLKLEASVAGTMAAMLPAAGPVGAGIATAIGAVVFVMEVVSWLEGEDDSVRKALESMQSRIDEIVYILNLLDQRMDELVNQVAIESNRQTNRDLLDYLDEIRNASSALASPALDVEEAVRIANASGITLDKFIRQDYDIWRWTDVVIKETYDPATGKTHPNSALATEQFKHLPTLPVYLMAVLTWLAARERAARFGAKSRLDGDADRIARHLAAVTVRQEFDKYENGEAGIARSIPEHIKSRIRAAPISSGKYPVGRICKWAFEVQNWMDGDIKRGDPFDVVMDSDHVLCTLDPASLGAPALELDMETACGIEMLESLRETLEHVSRTGTLRKPFIGQFSNETIYPPAVMYVVTQNGDLEWYRNEQASRPGGSKEWNGPIRVGTGWGHFKQVFSGGGAAIYAIKPDGGLMWYGHNGYFDGTSEWRGEPLQVGYGWQGFKSVFAGGEYIVYGIEQDGDLIWYRHDGASYGGGESTWAPSAKVGSGWERYTSVFSGGEGMLYAIREDGVLERHLHTGYLKGTAEWGPKEEIGNGWNGFMHVEAAGDGVLYAFTRDGRVLWFRYGERRKEKTADGTKDWKQAAVTDIEYIGPLRNGGVVLEKAVPSALKPTRLPGGFNLKPIQNQTLDWKKLKEIELKPIPPIKNIPTLPPMAWEGPVEVMRGLPGFRSVFTLKDAPYQGPR